MAKGVRIDNALNIGVFSEVGHLRQVLVHCPDKGVGGVIPSKAQEWLYEDIVDLKRMRKEFSTFKKLLLAYLDPEKLKEWLILEKSIEPINGVFISPMSENYIKSDKVIDIQDLLADVLDNQLIRSELVSAICAIEDKSYHFQKKLMDSNLLTSLELSRILITGHVNDPKSLGLKHHLIWSPSPNLLFTRDIGVVIGDELLLSRTSQKARRRESLLTRYIAYHHLFKSNEDQIVEIKPDSLAFLLQNEDIKARQVTIEGGDVMMISPKHLLIGCSERTTPYAIQKLITTLFQRGQKVLEKVSVIDLPKQRSMMHLDTVMTQVDRGTWVTFKPLLEGEEMNDGERILLELGMKPNNGHTVEPAKVTQFMRLDKKGHYRINDKVTTLKSLLVDISTNEYGVKEKDVKFIYSADGMMIHAEREQWTDSCNVVAIKEGVVIGYDRNDKTAQCFKEAGFEVIEVKKLIWDLTKAFDSDNQLDIAAYLAEHVPEKALLLLPSAELSRARGGPHCMTMPVRREVLFSTANR
ncbi:arginine deiminase family protein [Thiotrichales bacterium 19S11-10]|nr:arginine deiminase family protein [Thiotrichales bacterium 19S11-10]